MRGALSKPRLDGLVDAINHLDFKPDLVIHSGDIANDPENSAYALAAESLSRLRVPCYYVTGNHDDADLIKQHLEMGPHVPLSEDPSVLFYKIDLPDHTIFVLDGKVPEEQGPHGHIDPAHLKVLSEELDRCTTAFSVFCHYPALPLYSPWIDKHLLLDNGEDVHQLLKEHAGDRFRGFFFGHVHRGVQMYRDGIFYAGVSSSACQFSAASDDSEITFDSDCPLYFNHINLDASYTVVKEYTIEGFRH